MSAINCDVNKIDHLDTQSEHPTEQEKQIKGNLQYEQEQHNMLNDPNKERMKFLVDKEIEQKLHNQQVK